VAFTNVIKPFGLSPVNNLIAGMYNGQVNLYCIAPADTNPYYPGDLVKISAGGDTYGTPLVTLATAGATAVGAITAVGLAAAGPGGIGGPVINPNNLSLTSRPSGAQTPYYYCLVADDPTTIFEIEEGGAGTNLTQTIIGEYANILYAAPATGVYVSGTTLNNGSVSATPGVLNLKILRLAPRVDNHFTTTPATGGGGQKWWVRINNHSYNGVAVTGV
jgi:hypothetical protein